MDQRHAGLTYMDVGAPSVCRYDQCSCSCDVLYCSLLAVYAIQLRSPPHSMYFAALACTVVHFSVCIHCIEVTVLL